ncbi:MAG: tripartite tricarboxylate transporter TctB family protein [Pseudomonadota bacterium]
MAQWNKAELTSAAAFVVVGIGALVIALDYPLGSITRMGPGFAPVAISLALIVVGLVLAAQGRTARQADINVRMRPFLLILGGILIWALLIDRFGFFAASIPLVLCCAAVEMETTPTSAAILTIGLCLVGFVIFIWGIGVPMSTFGK